MSWAWGTQIPLIKMSCSFSLLPQGILEQPVKEAEGNSTVSPLISCYILFMRLGLCEPALLDDLKSFVSAYPVLSPHSVPFSEFHQSCALTLHHILHGYSGIHGSITRVFKLPSAMNPRPPNILFDLHKFELAFTDSWFHVFSQFVRAS